MNDKAGQEQTATIPFDEIFSGTAVFANKVYITLTPMGVRLSFMELPPEGPERFRSGVYLSLFDAQSLHAVLGEQLKQVQVSVKEVTPGKATPPSAA